MPVFTFIHLVVGVHACELSPYSSSMWQLYLGRTRQLNIAFIYQTEEQVVSLMNIIIKSFSYKFSLVLFYLGSGLLVFCTQHALSVLYMAWSLVLHTVHALVLHTTWTQVLYMAWAQVLHMPGHRFCTWPGYSFCTHHGHWFCTWLEHRFFHSSQRLHFTCGLH